MKHCRNGHAVTPETTYESRRADGRVVRTCIICRRERASARVRTDAAFVQPAEIARLNRQLQLIDQLSRETRAWIRDELKAELRELA